MIVIGKLINKIDPRKLMFAGMLISIFGIELMCHYNLQTEKYYWILSGVIQGFGLGFFFIPISTICFSTLPEKAIPEAAGIFSFSRNIGISMGISILSTIITNESQINWNRLAGHLNAFNPNLNHFLNVQGWTLHSPVAIQYLAKTLGEQASIIAFLDAFWLAGFGLLLMLPLLFLLKKPSRLRLASE